MVITVSLVGKDYDIDSILTYIVMQRTQSIGLGKQELWINLCILFTHPSLCSPEGSQEMSFDQSIGNYLIRDINDAITYKNLYN